MHEPEPANRSRLAESVTQYMVWLPGGTFRMGSDQHYPEEAPAHTVSVNGFWIDRTPVTNRQFKEFVRATGHRTFAEIPPDPKNYPGALPHMLYAGSLVFTPPSHPVDLKNLGEWWAYTKGADWRHPYGPKSNINTRDNHPVLHVAFSDALAYAKWAGNLSVFDLIRYRQRDSAAVLCAFDLIELDGEDLRQKAIEERKHTLANVLFREHDGIAFNRHYDCDGAIIFKHACSLGCEGIVSKRVGSPYRSGRVSDWIKVKNPAAPAVKREAEEDWGSKRWIRQRNR